MDERQSVDSCISLMVVKNAMTDGSVLYYSYDTARLVIAGMVYATALENVSLLCASECR
jgi:hypothetical protein